ncbi:DNA-3-methyladenine glycosylase I [bacterium]|nr:DNA-3-methyladenine glycosylase I [bacterium]MBU1883308.1 DNA-3-methyladenine glycosylase I [bacterium]
MNQQRCGWVKLDDPVYVEYHDKEWGRAIHDDKALFELFSLETQSAGLSWLTVLKKRKGYREVFEGFDIARVAKYDDADIDKIVDSGLVIKSRPKIAAIINNAKCFETIIEEFGSIDNYFWSKVGGRQIINDVPDYKTAVCHTNISDEITKELKKRGFKFIGSTTIYAFMQACGMVNDHENSCFCK